MQGKFGVDSFGLTPYGGGNTSFEVTGASSISPFVLVLGFNVALDVTYTNYLNPANYTIPGLTVSRVEFDSAFALRLFTSEQVYQLYTVTVEQARSIDGVWLNPLHKTATFTGTGNAPGFLALATGQRRVRLVFSNVLYADANLTKVSNYNISSISGAPVGINSVSLEQTTDTVSLVLILSEDLVSTSWYSVEISPDVKTREGLSIEPPTKTFQWVSASTTFELGISDFSGEVHGDLFGNPLGLVYFSPALDLSAANSVLQVEEVSVCTTAYDTYEPPQPIDPATLFLYGGPTQPLSVLGSTALWAGFPRLSEARLDLTLTPTEAMPAALDGQCTATFTEPWDPAFISYLNNPNWHLYDGTPTTFITANNLAPIPPGPTVTIILAP